MNRTSALVVAIVFAVCSAVCAEYSVWDKGMWPQGWPKELEPLRKQARTFESPKFPDRRYLIPFTKREDFEAAWPHLVKVKSKGAPIILLRGPKTGFFEVKPAGVLIQTPPVETDNLAKWKNASLIELVVDGQIVDLNRIQLPPDTPIIDERFKEGVAK